MAIVFGDRVKETTTTTGTGTLTLAGATPSYQNFNVIGDGNQCAYSMTDGTDWECGIGTFTLSGRTLSRDTVVDSSNAGALVVWPAGNKFVSNTPLSDYAKQQYEQSYKGIRTTAATADTLVAEDAGKIIEYSAGTAIAVTIPLDAAVNFPIGTRIEIIQTGLGVITVSHAGTLWGFASTGGQYYAISMYKRAADHWVLIGGVP